jgi:gliding motility-associated protein GldE
LVIEIVVYILLFLVLLALSAFFSGAETAFFSLSSATIAKFSNSDKSSERRVAKLMELPRQLLITIVLGNTIVNVTIATVAAILTTRICQTFGFNEKIGIVIDVIVVTIVILILSEVVPKVVAVRNSQTFSRLISSLLYFVFYLLYPIAFLLSRFTRFLQYKIGLSQDKMFLSAGELKTLVEVGEEHGTLEKDERAMIHSIFEFGETTVKEIMVPRTDMITVSTDTTLSAIMELVKVKLHSRIPVYDDRIDNIKGILYVKDLLPYLSKSPDEKIDLEKLARPAYFVPEQKKIDELLREFQKERMHMAIVVDEYGGISGLATLEDVIEEIVGEIQDEYDKESPLFNKVDENTFMVDGRMTIEEINEELRLNLPIEEGVETISGFILNILGSVPKEKEMVKFNGYEFIVERVLRNRILKVRIEKKPSDSKIQDEIQN